MRRWWRLWWDRDVLCAVHRSQWRLCCGKGMTKQRVLVRRNLSEIWTRKNLTTFGLQPVTTLFERGTECEYIHSKGNCPFFQMPYLAKSYDAWVVSYLAWKLGVTFFWITLYIVTDERAGNLLMLNWTRYPNRLRKYSKNNFVSIFREHPVCVQNFKSISSKMAELWHKTCWK